MNFADLVAKEREGLPKDELFGLAISGGGIRSATLALGCCSFLHGRSCSALGQFV